MTLIYNAAASRTGDGLIYSPGNVADVENPFPGGVDYRLDLEIAAEHATDSVLEYMDRIWADKHPKWVEESRELFNRHHNSGVPGSVPEGPSAPAPFSPSGYLEPAAEFGENAGGLTDLLRGVLDSVGPAVDAVRESFSVKPLEILDESGKVIEYTEGMPINVPIDSGEAPPPPDMLIDDFQDIG